MVFEDHTIEHLPCENLPKGLDAETYVLIFRKEQACIRHEMWEVMEETGGMTEDPSI